MSKDIDFCYLPEVYLIETATKTGLDAANLPQNIVHKTVEAT